MNDCVTLILAETGKDGEGYAKLKILRENDIYAETGDPKRAQRDSAMRQGYTATLKVKVNLVEYNDENYLRHNNKMYEIKEAYKLDENYKELTCSDMRCKRGKV